MENLVFTFKQKTFIVSYTWDGVRINKQKDVRFTVKFIDETSVSPVVVNKENIGYAELMLLIAYYNKHSALSNDELHELFIRLTNVMA